MTRFSFVVTSLAALATLLPASTAGQVWLGDELCTGRPQGSAALETTNDTIYVVTTRAGNPGQGFSGRAGGSSYYLAKVTLREPRRDGVFDQMEDEGFGRRLCRRVEYARINRDIVLGGARNRLGIPGPWHHGALVFVHGFNSSFEDAVDRAVVIKHRLRYDGMLILFSWPSESHNLPSPSTYSRDSASADQSVLALRRFLTTLAERTDPSRVHLIAHSMGSRVLAGALEAGVLPRTGRYRNRQFASVSFLAPDIDANVFKDRVVPTVHRNAARISLYATEGDRALAGSQELHSFAGAAGVARDVLARRSTDFRQMIPRPRAGEVFGIGRDAVRSRFLETIVLPYDAPTLWGESIWGLRKLVWVRSAIRGAGELDDIIRHSMQTEGTALYDLLWNVGRNIRAECRAERELSSFRDGIWWLTDPDAEIIDYRAPSVGCQMVPDTLRTTAELVVDLYGDSITAVRAVYSSLRAEGHALANLSTRPGRKQGDLVVATRPQGTNRVQITTYLSRMAPPVILGTCRPETMYRVSVSARELAPRLRSSARDVSHERVAFVVRRLTRELTRVPAATPVRCSDSTP
jgi:pimeloyl-ACP methyl ester carboxylesterase